jgi:Outer membrane lipoprotein-sorting protein
MVRNSVIGLVCLLVLPFAAAQDKRTATKAHPPATRADATSVNLQTIVDKMEVAAQANRQAFRPYIVTREYRIYSKDSEDPNSTIFADVTFIPPKTETFNITDAHGSSRGRSIVRHVLERQQEAAIAGTAPGAVTRQHYAFSYLGEEKLGSHDCYVLKITAKSKTPALLDGEVWVDKHSYLVRKLEGDMSKTPSWWLKSVHLTLTFNDVHGMWLQTHGKAIVEVRIFGRHVFQADDVAYQTSSVLARKSTPKTSGNDDTSRVLGSAVVQ